MEFTVPSGQSQGRDPDSPLKWKTLPASMGWRVCVVSLYAGEVGFGPSVLAGLLADWRGKFLLEAVVWALPLVLPHTVLGILCAGWGDGPQDRWENFWQSLSDTAPGVHFLGGW